MALSANFRTACSRLSSIPAQNPFTFGVGVSCVKTCFSDILVQKAVERREKIDWKRNLAFGCFGFFYLGMVQYGLYVTAFGRLFPNASKFAAKSLSQKIKDTKGMMQVGMQVRVSLLLFRFDTKALIHTNYNITTNFSGLPRPMRSPSLHVLSSFLLHEGTRNE